MDYGDDRRDVLKEHEVDGIRKAGYGRLSDVFPYKWEVQWIAMDAAQRDSNCAGEFASQPGSLILVPSKGVT